MFNLFGKKKEKETAPAAPAPENDAQGKAYKALAAQFSPEELDILALTGTGTFGGTQLPDQELWATSITLTAWMEEDEEEVRQEAISLVALADERLMGFLRQRLPPNFIIKCKARLSHDGTQLLLTNLPEPGFDPDLKALLEEQKKPVTFETEDMGTFTLRRTMGWFEAEADWLGQAIQLTIDEEHDQEDSLSTARALLADPARWDEAVRAYAARELLELGNRWVQEFEDGEPVTQEEFAQALELESIQIGAQGAFSFCFNGGELFFGHAIQVDGSLAQGCTAAQGE